MTDNKIPLSVIPGFYVDGSLVAPTQPPDNCPATLAPEPPNAPDTCPACGARKRIDSGEFVHYVCGVCYWREGQKVVSDLYSDHVAAIALRAELAQTKILLTVARASASMNLDELFKELDAQKPDILKEIERTNAECDAALARLAELQAVVEAARLLYNALKWLRHLSFTDERVVWPGEETRLLVDGSIAAYDAALASGTESEMTK